MKYRPILFSGPMVRALLAGTKTQTRRVVKPQPDRICPVLHLPRVLNKSGDGFDVQLSPYGQPGDRLWVRETFCLEHSVESDQPPPFNDGRPIKRRNEDDCNEFDPLWLQPHYRATDPTPELCYENAPTDDPMVRWKPSIHMPRWASRITLEITGVRVERLQDISEADAVAEGCKPIRPELVQDGLIVRPGRSAVEEFRLVWESINGPGSWDANPWVWVIEFKMEQQEAA